MKVLKKVLFFILTLIMVFLVVLLFAKKEYSFQQSVTIDKNSSEVYNFLKFLQNQENYHDWRNKDKASIWNYYGEDGTTSSKCRWESNNKQVLSGVQSITKLNYPEHIKIEMLVDKPYNISSIHDFILKENNGKTELTWNITIQFPFPYNILILTDNFDNTVKQSVATSLNNIKKELEK